MLRFTAAVAFLIAVPAATDPPPPPLTVEDFQHQVAVCEILSRREFKGRWMQRALHLRALAVRCRALVHRYPPEEFNAEQIRRSLSDAADRLDRFDLEGAERSLRHTSRCLERPFFVRVTLERLVGGKMEAMRRCVRCRTRATCPDHP